MGNVNMGFYDRWILPPVLDFAMRQAPFPKQRAKVIPRAQGRVLEIGIGSGLNLAFYDRTKVTKLYGLDPSEELRRRALQRSREANLEVEFIGLTGEDIPLDDGSVDSVVTTFTLCTIPDGLAALREMRRVLRPGGELILAEHGLAPDANVAKWQDRLSPYWKHFAGGCHLNRRIAEMVPEAGFEVSSLERDYLPGPRPMSYHYWGAAVRPA